ncbi:MAG: 3-oxoacyl-ACP synthase [Nitrospirae bacterium CG2_30_70_394]|nr:MAG: 3-oxoacyl-ACP synthase [Nitrospirae bacterium CG2_30_70_394]
MLMPRARIIGTGSYLPEQVLTNQDLERKVETSDAWIVERTGIRERHIAAATEQCSDLAIAAARRAIAAAGIAATEIDLVVVASATPDMAFPSTACLVQRALGCGPVAAFDLSAACSGFVYALTVGDQFIRGGAARTVLVIGSEVLSRIVDWTDRTTCVLFGDGAGAVILQASNTGHGILSCHLHAEGKLADLLMVAAPGKRNPGTGEVFAIEGELIQMRGNETFRVAVRTLGEVVGEALAANQMVPADVDWLIPHQANIRIIEATAKRLGLPMEQVVVNVDRVGNTSAASIPIALDEAARDGRLQEGQTVLLEAFGGGLTWGAVVMRW